MAYFKCVNESKYFTLEKKVVSSFFGVGEGRFCQFFHQNIIGVSDVNIKSFRWLTG